VDLASISKLAVHDNSGSVSSGSTSRCGHCLEPERLQPVPTPGAGSGTPAMREPRDRGPIYHGRGLLPADTAYLDSHTFLFSPKAKRMGLRRLGIQVACYLS
jgi:hypothetical protein